MDVERRPVRLASPAEHLDRCEPRLAEVARLVRQRVLANDAAIALPSAHHPYLHAIQQVAGHDLEPRSPRGNDVVAVRQVPGEILAPEEHDGVGARLAVGARDERGWPQARRLAGVEDLGQVRLAEVLSARLVERAAVGLFLVEGIRVPAQVPVRVDDALQAPRGDVPGARAGHPRLGRNAEDEEDARAIHPFEVPGGGIGAAAHDEVEGAFRPRGVAPARAAVHARRGADRHQLLPVERVPLGAVVVRGAELGVHLDGRHPQVPTDARPPVRALRIVGERKLRLVRAARGREPQRHRHPRRSLAVRLRRLDEVDAGRGICRLHVLDRRGVEGGRTGVVRRDQHRVDHEGEVRGLADQPAPRPVEPHRRQRLPALRRVVIEVRLHLLRAHSLGEERGVVRQRDGNGRAELLAFRREPVPGAARRGDVHHPRVERRHVLLALAADADGGAPRDGSRRGLELHLAAQPHLAAELGVDGRRTDLLQPAEERVLVDARRRIAFLGIELALPIVVEPQVARDRAPVGEPRRELHLPRIACIGRADERRGEPARADADRGARGGHLARTSRRLRPAGDEGAVAESLSDVVPCRVPEPRIGDDDLRRGGRGAHGAARQRDLGHARGVGAEIHLDALGDGGPELEAVPPGIELHPQRCTLPARPERTHRGAGAALGQFDGGEVEGHRPIEGERKQAAQRLGGAGLAVERLAGADLRVAIEQVRPVVQLEQEARLGDEHGLRRQVGQAQLDRVGARQLRGIQLVDHAPFAVAAAQPQPARRRGAVEAAPQNDGPLHARRLVGQDGAVHRAGRQSSKEVERSARAAGVPVERHAAARGAHDEGVVVRQVGASNGRVRQRGGIARSLPHAHAPQLQLGDGGARPARREVDGPSRALLSRAEPAELPAIHGGEVGRSGAVDRRRDPAGARQLDPAGFHLVGEGQLDVDRRVEVQRGRGIAVEERGDVGAVQCAHGERRQAGRRGGPFRALPRGASHREQEQQAMADGPSHGALRSLHRKGSPRPASQTRCPRGAGVFPHPPGSPRGWP